MWYSLYGQLQQKLGFQRWWNGNTRFEICVGMVLTQNTSWANAEKALDNLKQENILTPMAILSTNREKLLTLIKPAGLQRQKYDCLRRFAKYVIDHYDGDLDHLFEKPAETLRKELLGIKGVGSETCDTIMLYAANKPVFIVDKYTKRIFTRIGIVEQKQSDEEIKKMVTKSIGKELAVLKEFHALLINFAKTYCKKKPVCPKCFLAERCRAGKMLPECHLLL